MKFGYTLFLALFVVLCLCPLVGMWILGPSEAAANEILAQPPVLRSEEGEWNADVLSDASDYLADRFAGRQELITVNARIEAALLGESANDDVILGKDGWLFYASTTDDYRNENLLTEREIFAAAHNLRLMQDHARQQGMQFFFTLVANKNTLYPEFMPEAPAQGSGNREALMAALESEGVNTVDLLSPFAAQERVLYHRLDSHWTKLGAALASDTILRSLGREASDFDAARFSEETSHDGDLYAMLYPAGTEKDVQYEPVEGFRYEYTKPLRSVEDQMILTACEGGEGSLFLFRDSFGNTLHSFLADHFAAATFSKAMPYDLSQVMQAEVLGVEIVERNIPWLASRPPILPAPERQLELPQETTMPEPALETSRSANGQPRLNGELTITPDADAPIWVVCGAQVFEACLQGERGFAVCLTTEPTTVQIMTRCDGKLILSQPMDIHFE